MNLRIALCSLAFIAVLAPREQARAWSCMRFGCPAYCSTPTYSIGALSSDLEAASAGLTEAEVQRAMGDWTLVSCTDLTSSYAGRTTASAVDGDGLSVIEFVDSGWPYDASMIGGTTQVYQNNCIVESDIVLNGQHYDFVTRPGYGVEVNAYSVVLHEGGHFYGLGHSQYPTAAMYFRYGIGSLELAYDDSQGICSLYPGSGTQDCTVNGCPSGQMCSGTTCVDAPKPACTSDNDCISIQRCNLATGRCENRPTTGTDLGTTCSVDGDCATALCLPTAQGSICSQTCDALDPYSCPSGFYCSGDAVSDCAIGVCLPGDPGHGAFGTPCSKPTDCASLFCGNGICSAPCERGVVNACTGGYTCHPSSVGACGVCGPATPIGGLCEDSAECRNGLCFDPDLDGSGFCTAACTSDLACPAGYGCDDLGSESICAPRGELRGGSCSAATPHAGNEGLLFAFVVFGVTLAGRRATKRR